MTHEPDDEADRAAAPDAPHEIDEIDAITAIDEVDEILSLEVPPEAAGSRLDVFLARALETSRARARKWLEAGHVELEGRRATARDKGRSLDAGMRLKVAGFRHAEDERIAPEPPGAAGAAIASVLAHGPGWLAVDKRAGAPVHPFSPDETGTVMNAVAALHPEVQGVGERGLKSGVVHRLDVDTSGVLLVATQEPAWQRLRAAFRAHRVEKRYRAIVAGALEAPIDQQVGLVVARHRPARVKVVELPGLEAGEGVWRAEQRIRPVERLAGATLVEVWPRSGFLHQIRATLAALGHPLLGDATYGDTESRAAAPRHMLHAASIGFEEIEATSADPADFAETLSRLRSARI